MKTHQKAAAICFAVIFIFFTLVMLQPLSSPEDRAKIVLTFVSGIVIGGSWVILVLYDPQTKYTIKKEGVEK